MKFFIEPLILYWVLFLRFSAVAAPPGEPVEFSIGIEIGRMLLYSIPSLLLLWYLMLKAKSLEEWGVELPRKRDILAGGLAFPALLLIGVTISLVSPHFSDIPAGPQFLPPKTAVSWAVLSFSCLISSYLEESYFRLYLISRRKEMGLGLHRAVLVSTLLFSICHAYEGPWGFLNAVLSGLLLAFIFVRFRSLHGIAVAHALYNIVVYVLGALPTGRA